jgi:hypothetical protein
MKSLNDIEERFENHLRTVDELIAFDRIIMDVCINHIEILNERLKNGPLKINNPLYLAENTLKTIKNIRENDSLRPNYLSMFNSCLVLQVSYFTSIIDDIFKYSTNYLFINKNRIDLDIKTLKANNDVNFQNMQSTIKAYKKYLDIEVKKDTICNTIILAQSSRHALVHSLGYADEKFINNTNSNKPRDIKHEFTLNQRIQFSSSELEFVKFAMQVFVTNLCDEIKKKHQII